MTQLFHFLNLHSPFPTKYNISDEVWIVFVDATNSLSWRKISCQILVMHLLEKCKVLITYLDLLLQLCPIYCKPWMICHHQILQQHHISLLIKMILKSQNNAAIYNITLNTRKFIKECTENIRLQNSNEDLVPNMPNGLWETVTQTWFSFGNNNKHKPQL